VTGWLEQLAISNVTMLPEQAMFLMWLGCLNRLVIPNVIPLADMSALAGEEKPVWRLAFFSRLEQRKGLKLFVEAVSRLDPSTLSSR
jgi:hypothetical protein